MLVLVTGLPGSGKTTVATGLAEKLGVPLIAKDRFKEILFDTLGIGDIAWSRRLGAAAVALQHDAMRVMRDAVVDSALWTDLSEPDLEALALPLVQVYCACPFELARSRFFARSRLGARHPGFLAEKMSVADFERFRPLTEPLRLKAPLLEVDTSVPVDMERLAAQVRRIGDETERTVGPLTQPATAVPIDSTVRHWLRQIVRWARTWPRFGLPGRR